MVANELNGFSATFSNTNKITLPSKNTISKGYCITRAGRGPIISANPSCWITNSPFYQVCPASGYLVNVIHLPVTSTSESCTEISHYPKTCSDCKVYDQLIQKCQYIWIACYRLSIMIRHNQTDSSKFASIWSRRYPWSRVWLRTE